MNVNNILIIIVAYLLGSIPTAVWYSKLFFGKDVRTQGSGNAGFTNMVRLAGFKKALPVLIVDFLKGFFAVLIAEKFSPGNYNVIILAGIFAILGHVFPIFAGFKGGKGVLTSLGVVFYLYPVIAIIALLTFLLVFFKTRIVSISSLFAALVFLIISLIDYTSTQKWINNKYYMIFAALMVAIVFITHRSNIQRLIKKEELSFKDSQSEGDEEDE